MSVYQYVRKQLTGDPFAKAVLIAIAHYANWEYGHCYPSAQTLANDCECGERTVRGKLEYLAEKGFIRLDPRPGKTPMITIEGYREWFLEGEQRARKTPAAPAGVRKQTPAAHADTPAAPADELTREQHSYNNPSESKYIYNPLTTPLPPSPAATATRINNLDEWEQAPPTQAHPVVSEEGSIENPSPPWDEPKQGARGGSEATQAKEVAARAGEIARLHSVSTKDWVSIYREVAPAEFNAWVNWMEANSYMQAVPARTRGYLLAPAMEPTPEAIETYQRKFGVANHAQKCNAS